MYDKVDTNLNFVKREEETVKFWKEKKIFEKTLEKTANGDEFSFYDGPPTANGKPHIGHILTRVMKDIIPRYHTMKGRRVLRKAGWDTHGLPVELEVEKLLGIDGKQEIEKYGVIPFINKCKESVFRYVDDWRKMTDRVGYWVDMDTPYVTYHDNYIESVWWSLKQIFDKGLIYKGHKIVPYCPRCGTALSSHEVAQGYKDTEEQTAVVKFRVDFALKQQRAIKSSKADKFNKITEKITENTYILAWTTTPWTLPSNTALCMHPDHEYCLIEAAGEKFILAKELVSKHFDEYTIIETAKGADLEGLRYQPLFNYYKNDKQDCWFVTTDGYVTLSDGTGVVHIAPAFGEDDARVGKKYNLPFVQFVSESGRFVKDVVDFFDMFVKDADKHILKSLAQKNLLFKTLNVTHSYPFCWRCDTPLLYYARSTWFIKMTEMKERLIQNNSLVNWMPDTIGKGRMGNFLENVVDWGLSRERYWGTPLPIWVCGDCGHLHAVGSKSELIRMGGLKEGIELHKPFVDAVTFKCEKCGGVMKRTPEVIDCWYDSGAMPFAQYHYPFENKDVFEKTFPASFISEAVDQTRGWFYTLLAISTLLFDKPAFKNCTVLGLVCDKNGIKMSKHKGNGIDPWTILDKQGADAVRWYFYTASAPWLPFRFSEDAVIEAQRKFLGTLWNTYSFYVLYAEIDKFNPTLYNLTDCELSLMDKWLLSGLNSLVLKVDKDLSEFKIFESAREISEFTDRLSNWYVRRCRERYWESGMEKDKIAAYMTLFTTLKTLSLVCAPYVPFMAESIYQNIVKNVDKNAPESVHLCDFPVADFKYINEKLEKGMEFAVSATTLGRAARATANIKNRQPLSRMLLSGDDKPSGELLEIIKGELNIKEIEFISGAGAYFSYEVKPQLKTLGPKYGAKLNVIREKLKTDAEKVVEGVKSGEYRLELGNGEFALLTAEDVLISVINKEGFSAASEGGMTVVLDTVLTPELVREGHMREIVSKIQNLRKESGFEVTDHIILSYSSADTEIDEVFKAYKKEIMCDILADDLIAENAMASGSEININGKKIYLNVKKA